MQDGQSQAPDPGSAPGPDRSAAHGSLRRDVALLATPTLFQSLRHALETTGFIVHSPNNFTEYCCTTVPDAIIIEVTDELEPIAEALLSKDALSQTPFIFVGPVSVEGIEHRKVTELSADVSVPEVARVCRAACQGTVASPMTQPPAVPQSSPFSTLPRDNEPTAEAPASVPGAASLLLSAGSPSSRPPKPRTSSIPGSTWADSERPLSRESSPIAFSASLLSTLRAAEEKAAKLSERRQSAEPKGASPEPRVELDRDILEALAQPIGGEGRAPIRRAAIPPQFDEASRTTTGKRTAPPSTSPTDSDVQPEAVLGVNNQHKSRRGASAEDPSPTGTASTSNPQPAASAPPTQDSTDGERDTGSGTTSRKELTDAERKTEPPPRKRAKGSGAAHGLSQRVRKSATTHLLTDRQELAVPPEPAPANDRGLVSHAFAIPSAPALPRLNSKAPQHIATPEPLVPKVSSSAAPQPPPPESAHGPSTLPPSARVTEAPGSINAKNHDPEHTKGSVLPQGVQSESIDHPKLRHTDAARLVARAICKGWTGSAVFEDAHGVRRLILSDGDIVTAVSGVRGESLLAHLVSIGHVQASVQQQLEHKLPSFGRHAGAALVASGHIGQDELWPVLRSHAEFIVGQCVGLESGSASLETAVPERLRAEPSVFGGSAGAEVFVEIVRGVVSPDQALQRLGGTAARWSRGHNYGILEECALSEDERKALSLAMEQPMADVIRSTQDHGVASALWALRLLGVLKRQAPPEASAQAPSGIEATTLREHVANRRRLVEEGDYFTLLGISRKANNYDVEQAYRDLKERFDPSVVLTPSTADLSDDVSLILDVLDEAYAVLGGSDQRERYRRALESHS